MKYSFLSAIKQNKSWLGLTIVLVLSFFSGFSNPAQIKTPVKVQTEWVVSTKEVKTSDHSDKLNSIRFVSSAFPGKADLYSELYQNRIVLISLKANPGISIQLPFIFVFRNFPQSKKEDPHTA